MSDQYKVTYKALEDARNETTEWKEKHKKLEQSVVKDIEAMEATVVLAENRREALEKVVLDHCRKILGKCFSPCTFASPRA